MKREFSAGGIIFNKEGKVLLINNAAMGNPKRSYWGFSKGHINQGESGRDAALREVQEETGIEAEILEKVGDNKYMFSWEGEKIFKVVSMFLMRYKAGKLKIQSEELLDAGWFSPKEALEKLSFSNDKKLLQKALDILEKKV